jgi:hypothetical protein
MPGQLCTLPQIEVFSDAIETERVKAVLLLGFGAHERGG